RGILPDGLRATWSIGAEGWLEPATMLRRGPHLTKYFDGHPNLASRGHLRTGSGRSRARQDPSRWRAAGATRDGNDPQQPPAGLRLRSSCGWSDYALRSDHGETEAWRQSTRSERFTTDCKPWRWNVPGSVVSRGVRAPLRLEPGSRASGATE